MWDTCALGDDCPKTIRLTIYMPLLLIPMWVMGMRGRDEHHKYGFGDFALRETADGKKC